MSPPIIYLIRHGEKPPKNAEGEDPTGLSIQGVDRAQALVKVFGASSPYNIRYIIAQKPKENGNEDRPFLTVSPLAESLGSVVKFEHDIKRDEADKVAHAVRKWEKPGNILICWEHKHLTDVARAIGIQNAPEYPGERFDLIWKVPSPYDQIESITSEHCQGLDEKYKNDLWVKFNGSWIEENFTSS